MKQDNKQKSNNTNNTSKQQRKIIDIEPIEPIVEKKSYLSKKMTFLNYVMYPVFITLGYLASKFILNEEFKNVKHPLVEKITSEIFSLSKFSNFESKLNFLLFVFFLAAVFNLVLTLITMFARIFSSAPSPNAEEDNILLNTLNRIIQNNIEQAFIFFPLLAHFIFNVSDKDNEKLAVLYAALFLIGRVLFFLGYLLSLVFKIMPLRAVGFFMGTVANVFLIIKFIGNKELEKNANLIFA